MRFACFGCFVIALILCRPTRREYGDNKRCVVVGYHPARSVASRAPATRWRQVSVKVLKNEKDTYDQGLCEARVAMQRTPMPCYSTRRRALPTAVLTFSPLQRPPDGPLKRAQRVFSLQVRLLTRIAGDLARFDTPVVRVLDFFYFKEAQRSRTRTLSRGQP